MQESVGRRLFTSLLPLHDELVAVLEAQGAECRRIASLDELEDGNGFSQVLLLDQELLDAQARTGLLDAIETFVRKAGLVVAIYPTDDESLAFRLPSERVWAYCESPYPLWKLRRIIESAYLYLDSRFETERALLNLDADACRLRELNHIGIALSTERDHNALLDLILRKCREVTYADAGSLYLVEAGPSNEKLLRFKLSQNDSFGWSYQEFTMPISPESISGYVALSGESLNLADAYHLPRGSAFRLDRNWDHKTGYRTKSMLTVPMKNRKNEIIGIVQLINRKKHPSVVLVDEETVAEEVLQFDTQSEQLLNSLASQAAVALENNLLYKNIQDLFEGFVRAAVTAIESRDPTTSGHSARVAALTVALAEALDRIDVGPFADVHFSREQIKEIRYASLLHDFGKVGVREQVLIKAKKLYPGHFESVMNRFEFIRKVLETEHIQEQLACLLQSGEATYLAQRAQMLRKYEEALAEIERIKSLVVAANEPTILDDGNFLSIMEIATRTFLDSESHPRNFLTPDEVGFLSIRKGSLNREERLEIESHVAHTYRFLSQIPWTEELQRVPEIAYAHHEKLNGTGYPNQLAERAIPLQSKMMAVADIFDALTASDRPYKRAVATDRALKILEAEAVSGNIDSEILKVFVAERIYEVVEPSEPRSPAMGQTLPA